MVLGRDRVRTVLPVGYHALEAATTCALVVCTSSALTAVLLVVCCNAIVQLTLLVPLALTHPVHHVLTRGLQQLPPLPQQLLAVEAVVLFSFCYTNPARES